ncbi:hypothetical protein IV498_15840 [Paenarthrobacter sp. Z7-10]|uniref:hypothetical protein n=1 Tax=Paenarthrobacter sp. Z7-10 TaxID=2787635 RepID=UPI0022A993D9|nr:hypothetical protein [Paenarthrobacter sp. Z7-10]MCZ2404610.1 hypothetical protein [Paenarthrobacter sp. Z7-10]
MPDLSGFPYFEVQFTKDGAIASSEQAAALKNRLLAGSTPPDLLVLAHGWNNSSEEALRLYTGLLAQLRSEMDAGHGLQGPADCIVAGIIWPSKKFADAQLGDSAAASLSEAVTDQDLLDQIGTLAEIFDDAEKRQKLESLKALIPKLEDSPHAQTEFADQVRSLLGADAKEGSREDASNTFFKLSGLDLLERLGNPADTDETNVPGPDSGSGDDALDGLGGAADLDDSTPAGGAAGFGDFLTGIKAAARNLLNYATFYQMKDRAGTTGASGVNPMLRELVQACPGLRIHLVGHSFGARLVTAAVAGSDTASAIKPHSVVLLQAAFSHNGFSANFDGKGGVGAFRRVLADGLIQGPALVSYTHNDRAVGLAYPLASLISGTNAAAVGDENDPFGGLGRNGAQHTAESVPGVLLGVENTYTFERGKMYNLRADDVVANHSDIVHPEIAHAMLAAMAAH